MIYVLLILLFTFDCSHSNHPILIARPYPFNCSETSHIECFSNDQGIILSLTIIATMLEIDFTPSSLRSSRNNITKNGSIILTIPAPFNYSKLDSKIECRAKSYHGAQEIDQLDVISVVEIPQKELFSLDTPAKRMVTIHCLTYGTNVFVHWTFTRDSSKTIFGPLPIGIRINQHLTMNDTLIIDHVSYADHHGYYQCYATNHLLGRTYEDRSVIYLNVKKNTIWIVIVIGCVIIGLAIFGLILCSKYYQARRKEKDISTKGEETMETIAPNRKSTHFTPVDDQRIFDHIEKSEIQRGENLSRSSSSSLFIFPKSLQFVLSNPFLDPNAELISSIDQHSSQLK